MSKAPYDFSWLAVAPVANDPLRKEVADASWSDYGRTIYRHMNLNDHGFEQAVVRASMKAKNTAEMTSMLKAYLQTGILP